MAVTLTASNTLGFVPLGFPDESGGTVGAQVVVGIPKYNMIVNYGLKGYADQAALPYEHQALINYSVEAVDGDMVLKFKKFLVEDGENVILVDGPQKFVYAFSDTVSEVYGSNRGKAVINLSSGGTYKFYDPNQGKQLSRGIPAGLAWGFLTLLAVGADLLRYLLPPGPTWFKIHEYCDSLKIFFTVTSFALTVNDLEKSGGKHFAFKHVSMVLAIFILAVFQVLAEFNRPYPPPLISSIEMKRWKEKQPTRSLPHR